MGAARRKAGETRSGGGPEAFDELAKGHLAPIYAVDGIASEVDAFASAVKEAVFPPGSPGVDFNFERLVGRESGVTVARVIDTAQTLPAFAPRRLVWVTQADSLLPDKKDDVNEAFIRYVKDPSERTTLLLTADKWDRRTKVFKALAKAARVVRFDPPKNEAEMRPRIRAAAERFALEMDPDAVQALLSRVGVDLDEMRSAMEKLSLYLGERTRITRDDVEFVVPAVREESVFDLVDAIATGDRAQVLALLESMMGAQREPALRLLAMIARQYRMLVKARGAAAAQVPQGELASILGVPPFAVRDIVGQARRGDTERFGRALVSIATTDYRLKGGAIQVEELRVLERLALALGRDELLTP